MKNNAFTLLEIIIAMLILSIVTAGTYGLFVTNYKFLIEAKHRLQAVNFANTVLEKLRMYVSENPDLPVNAGVALEPGEHSPNDIGLDSIPSIDGIEDKEWTYSVSDVTDTDCKKVIVKVSWDGL